MIAGPRDPRRTVDVALSGLRARLADAGLVSHPVDHAAAARAALATLAWSGALFATFGAAMWSQLATGLQWAVPNDPGITNALDLMSLALLTFCVVAAIGLVGLIRAAIVTVVRGRGRTLRWPATLAVASTAVLVVGGRHFANAWPADGIGDRSRKSGMDPGIHRGLSEGFRPGASPRLSARRSGPR